MKIKVEEFTGEVGKIPEYLNYEFRIDLKAPGFLEQFKEEREKALSKYLKMKRRIIKNGSE
ncbi:hypothetical protein ES705_11141 [subsurface metagenome]